MRPGGRSAVRHVARRSAPRIRCVHSIIGHDSPVFQHGGPFSGAAGATRLMRIVRRQALPAKPARTRCIAAGSQHYERPMSTLPDWPGPNTTPPLHSQAKAFSAIGSTDPWSLSTRSAHSQAPRPTRRLADSFGAIGAPFAYGAFQHVRLARKHSKQRGLLRSEPYPLRGLSFCPDFPFSGTNLRL